MFPSFPEDKGQWLSLEPGRPGQGKSFEREKEIWKILPSL